MKKQLSIFLAIAFFAVQMGSFVHMAEHGLEHHEHKGEICQVGIYYQASHNFSDATPKLAVAHLETIEIISFSFADDTSRIFKLASTKTARAPPYFS